MTRFWMWLSMVCFNVYRWAGKRAKRSCRVHDMDENMGFPFCKRCHMGLLE